MNPVPDDSCYRSGLYAIDSALPDILALNFLVGQGIPLSERGYTPSEICLYTDGRRLMIAPLMGAKDESYFGPGGQSFEPLHKGWVTPDDYSRLLEEMMLQDMTKLTIIASNKLVTNELLKAECLTDILGKPNERIPHIEAKCAGKIIDIFTCN